MVLVAGEVNILAEILIGGEDKVLASGTAGLDCVRSDVGERMMCEKD